MKEFQIIAVPSRKRSTTEFRSTLHKIIENDGHSSTVALCETTRMIDSENLGDCFVVSLYIGSDHDGRLLRNLDPEAEVWVTGSQALPLPPPYGWKLEDFLCSSTFEPTSICTKLADCGLAIVKQATPTQQMDSSASSSGVSGCIEKVIADFNDHVAQLEEIVRNKYPHIHLGETAFGFQEYTYRGRRRFEVLFQPKDLLHQQLRDLFEPRFLDIACRYLNTEQHRLRLDISCVYSLPGSTDQEWHTDGDHYSFGANEESIPYALCIFVPLVALTTETGFTRFWPKSHLCSNLVGLGQAADVLKATFDSAGLGPDDCLFYSYTTWHKGIGNQSTLVRPIFQFLYSCDWYKERKNYGAVSIFD